MVVRWKEDAGSPPRVIGSIPGVDVDSAVGLQKTFDSNWFSLAQIVAKGYVNTTSGSTYYTLPSAPSYIPLFITMREWVAYANDSTNASADGFSRGTRLTNNRRSLRYDHYSNEGVALHNVNITYAILAIPFDDINDNPTAVPGTPRYVEGLLDGGTYGIKATPPGINALTAPIQRCNLDTRVQCVQLIERFELDISQFTFNGLRYVYDWTPPINVWSQRFTLNGKWMFHTALSYYGPNGTWWARFTRMSNDKIRIHADVLSQPNLKIYGFFYWLG